MDNKLKKQIAKRAKELNRDIEYCVINEKEMLSNIVNHNKYVIKSYGKARTK